ncbi:UNVERIFIED_CONTAM: hypothetical protein GTU68_036407 [Idotea baltica]|nr:hypothetical protein [Idotea baltica]
MSSTYKIKLKQFEGPFDLLLFFIERDELDIYDIPISDITRDYLDHIRQLERLNLDVASEFILVAATLMRIKAKLLLPRKEVDEQGNEIDPREELVLRLLEYKRYKSVLEEMRTKETERAGRAARGNIESELSQIAETALVDIELESVTLYKLMKAYERIMARLEEKAARPVHRIVQYDYTIQGEQKNMIGRIREFGRADFNQIFEVCENRIHAIVIFLGLLELLNLQKLHITQGLGPNNFWLTLKHTDEEE